MRTGRLRIASTPGSVLVGIALVLAGPSCASDVPEVREPIDEQLEEAQGDEGASAVDAPIDGADPGAPGPLGTEPPPPGERRVGGRATLTIGGSTWRFDEVTCATSTEEAGDDGAEFVLSAISDGLQLTVSIDDFGHTVSLEDIESFEEPRVAWTAQADGAGSSTPPVVRRDGDQVRAETRFVGPEAPAGIDGTLVASCS